MSARIRCGFTLVAALVLPSIVSAQLTNGMKPQLPRPFATRSAGNPPEDATPPKGFLPTLPPGFRINILTQTLTESRGRTTAPNGDIFLADTHGGKIYILRDPQHTGGAQQRIVW